MKRKFSQLHCVPQRGPFLPVRSIRVHTERRLAIVCGLGPSLASNLEQLQEHRSRLFIVAPFRVAMRLVEQGVIPDIVVLIEQGQQQYHLAASRMTESFVQSLREHGTSLLAHVRAPRAIVEKFRDRLRVFYFSDRLAPESVVLRNSTDSVSASVTLAVELGFARIGLVGVDCSDGLFDVPEFMAGPVGAITEIEFYDFGSGVVKHGWKKASILRVLPESPLDSCRISGRSNSAARRKAEKTLHEEAKAFRNARAQFSSASRRALSLVRTRTEPTTAESEHLRDLLETAEVEWRRDAIKHRAIEDLPAVYLSAFWDSGVQSPLNGERADRAVQQRGVLFFRELAERLHGS